MSSKTLEQEILEELDQERDENKGKKPKKEKTTGGQANTLIRLLLLLLAGIWISAGILMATLELNVSRQINIKVTTHQIQTLQNSANTNLQLSFATTQKELDAIANSPELINTLTLGTAEEQASLMAILKNSFTHSESLLLVPWDHTGTAGLKDRNIPLRNSIEMMLMTKAGNKKEAMPEGYLHEKRWLFSFISPITQDGQVIGALLLTLNTDFLTDIIDDPYYTSTAHIRVLNKQQPDKPIATAGVAAAGSGQGVPEASFDLPFTGGQLIIQVDPEKNPEASISFVIVYSIIGAVSLLLSLLTIVIHMFNIRSIKQNVKAITRFAEAKTGLHRTMRPTLSIGALEPVLDAVDILGNAAEKSKITPADPNKTVVAGKAASPPELLAVAEVKEDNRFEHPEIFKDYDIRGMADKQLTPETVVTIGKAIGSEAVSRGIRNIVVGRDGRLSSDRIQKSLVKGLCFTGCNVIDIGIVPTPVLYYATNKLNTNAGVMITGSHNPPEYNGFKIILDGKTLQGVQIQSLLKRIEKYNFTEESGSFSKGDVIDDYINEISSDIIIAKPLKVVLDAGHGVGGDVATRLFARLDCEVMPLRCEIDGKFPGYNPDPSSEEYLSTLIKNVSGMGADIGIALDGDADRMVAVTSSGKIIDGDQLLMIFARDIVSRNPAAGVVFDVKCSRNINKIVTEFGGRPIMSKSGHPHIKAKMQETGALLGGEFSGHYFFNERWYCFDDGIYAALRLVELLTTDETTLDERLESLPVSAKTGELVIPSVTGDDRIKIIGAMKKILASEEGSINTTDGLRMDYEKGWGLIRISNTTEKLSARFEAESDEELSRIKGIFKKALLSINPKLQLPF